MTPTGFIRLWLLTSESCRLGEAAVTGQLTGFNASTWETQNEFQTAGFGLAQPQPFQGLGNSISG